MDSTTKYVLYGTAGILGVSGAVAYYMYTQDMKRQTPELQKSVSFYQWLVLASGGKPIPGYIPKPPKGM